MLQDGQPGIGMPAATASQLDIRGFLCVQEAEAMTPHGLVSALKACIASQLALHKLLFPKYVARPDDPL